MFSKALNPRMTVLAVEGSYASVIGGAPAAAVVFAGDVDARTEADERVRTAEAAARPGRRRTSGPGWSRRLAELRAAVRSEKLGEVASEFDGVHSIHRAVRSARSTRSSRPASCGPRSSPPSRPGTERLSALVKA